MNLLLVDALESCMGVKMCGAPGVVASTDNIRLPCIWGEHFDVVGGHLPAAKRLFRAICKSFV